MLVCNLIFTPSHFFITSTVKQKQSQRKRPPLTTQSQLGTKDIGMSCASVAICSLTNESLALCRFMWALGSCGPVMVNLLFLSRCLMYGAIKSHTAASAKQPDVHTCLDLLWLLYPSLNCFYWYKPTLMVSWVVYQVKGEAQRKMDFHFDSGQSHRNSVLWMTREVCWEQDDVNERDQRVKEQYLGTSAIGA